MMISLPFLPPSDRNLQQYVADYQISDTVSESSDNASLLSLSQSDLAALGAGHIREDVRVSRKKLEALILKERETNPDRNFMESLMDRTNTYIQWPSRMKIGAKTKKDLYVRIYGHDPEEVNEVKMIVLAELGPHRDLRITLKMEISYTDHSHLIGCRGATIRRVMEDTGCHIHFPDSNRMSKEVKSNQVTIAGGSIGAVEQARSRVREQSPLIYQFTLPLITTAYDINLNQDSYQVFMDNIQQTYNVQVTTHPPNKLQQTMVSVKGCESNAPMIKEAITKIINYCSNGASLTSVTVESTMEISAVRHGFVRAVNDSNVHAIMINTGAKIIFPDLSDSNIQQIKRSKVFIAGDINAVYFARQQLIGCLPLRMIFDLSDEFHLDWEFVRQIGTDLNVNVKLINRNRTGSTSGTTGSSSLPPPVPGRSRTIQIEAAERNTGNIYEARRRILGGGEPPAIANIPVTYGMRQSMPPGLFPTLNGSRYNPVPSSLQLPPLIPSSPSLVSPILSPSFWPPTPFNSPFAMSPIQTHCIMPGMTTPTGQMPQNNNGNSSSRGQGIGQHGLPPIRISLTPGNTPTSDFPSNLGPPPGLYDHHGQNQQHMQPQHSPIFNHGNHPSNQMHSQHNGHHHHNNQSQMQFTFPRRERNEFFRDFEPQRRAPGWERRSNSQPNFLLSTANKNLIGGSNGNLKLSNLVSSPSMNKLSSSNAPLQLLPPIINGTNSSSVSVSSLSASSSTSSLIALQNKTEHNRDSPLNADKDKVAGITPVVENISLNGEKIHDPEFHCDSGVNDRKYLALKAMYETRIGNSPRVPNAEWAGMGFSRTHTALFPVSNSSPEESRPHLSTAIVGIGIEQNNGNGDDLGSLIMLNDTHPCTTNGANSVDHRTQDQTNLEPPKQELSNGTGGITRTHSPLTLQISNLLEFSGNTLTDAPDLPSLFIKNGLEKYIDNFLTEEINLADFQTLVEKDLRSLGVSSYPARKRMLLLISQLKLSSHNNNNNNNNNNRSDHPLWN